MIFTSKDRINELKTPKISNISLPGSDTTPRQLRRHSTTSTRTSTPAVIQASLPNTAPPNSREFSTTQAHSSTLRGGPSYNRSRVSSVSIPTSDEKAPPNRDTSRILPRPSAMSRRASEVGGGPSTTLPRKSVNFAVDKPESKHHWDGYATDSAFPERTSFGSRSGTGPAGSLKPNPAPARPTSRREVRVGGSSRREDLLNFEVGEASKRRLGNPKKYDGYATDGDCLSPSSPTRSRHGHSMAFPSQSEFEPASAKLSAAPSGIESPRGYSARTEAKSPGLHPHLLANASGKPPLRFNIIFPPATPYLKIWGDIPRDVGEDSLEESATETDLTAMAIQLHCDPLPPWECVIRRRKPVTCRDIFETIHKEYDAELTDAEKNKIPGNLLDLCRKGFKKRCKQAAGLTDFHESRGLKRVDLLLGKTLFRGVTKPRHNGPWVIELQMPPGYPI